MNALMACTAAVQAYSFAWWSVRALRIMEDKGGGSLELPIRKYTKDIVEAVKGNPVVVVIGETGSGKTTQISQVCCEANPGCGQRC